MRKRIAILGMGLVTALLAAQAAAFTQYNDAATAAGHDYLVVQGGLVGKGSFGWTATQQITGQSASCKFCDTYYTNNLKTWSAVMGNRWADIGGYNAITDDDEGVSYYYQGDKAWPGCFTAAIQDSDGVQYQHALRKKCDVGYSGLKRAHAGTVALIRDRFIKAVLSPEPKDFWFKDGGATVMRYRAHRPSFLLGIAIHALQDSFSTEHAVRSDDWLRIKDLKTYAGTEGALKHARSDDPDAENQKKFKSWNPWGGKTPLDNELHGDYVFSQFWDATNSPSELKPSAYQAMLATADLMKAFELARTAPAPEAAAGVLFAGFKEKWLELESQVSFGISMTIAPGCAAVVAGSPYGAGKSADAGWQKMEEYANACLVVSGVEPSLKPTGDMVGVVSNYPPFCWKGTGAGEDCADNLGDKAINGAIAAVKSGFAYVTKGISAFFGSIIGGVTGYIDHEKLNAAHSEHDNAKCQTEAGTLGSASGAAFAVGAHNRAGQFFSGLGNALSNLELADRKAIVGGTWKTLRDALITTEKDKARTSGCAQVEWWFGNVAHFNENKYSIAHRADAFAKCHAAFDQSTKALPEELDQVYEFKMKEGLPPPNPTFTQLAKANPPPGTTVPAPWSRPLKSFWSGSRADNFVTATDEGVAEAVGAGYALVRTEGYLFTKQLPGTVPLKTYWGRGRDNMATATSVGEGAAKDAGYAPVRTEGYVYETKQPNTIPLKLYWSDKRQDNMTLATAESEGAAKDAGYTFVRIEGYIPQGPQTQPPLGPPTPPAPAALGTGPFVGGPARLTTAFLLKNNAGLQIVLDAYKQDYQDCKVRQSGASFNGIAGETLCGMERNARLKMTGQTAPPPAGGETPAEKLERWHIELQACLRSPVMRHYLRAGTEKRCLRVYDDQVTASGLKPVRVVNPVILQVATTRGRWQPEAIPARAKPPVVPAGVPQIPGGRGR